MHKYIAVAYKLYSVRNGENHLEEEAPAEHPFQFISGFGISLEAFEKNIVDLATGDKFDFTLSQNEAFGEYDSARVLELDREMFTINGHFDHDHIFADAIVPMRNEDGNVFQARVLEVTESSVKMDFNAPLAGKELRFTGDILENRDATEAEVQALIARLSGGGCSCGCGGGCDGDCGGGCSDGGSCGGHDHHGCGCH